MQNASASSHRPILAIQTIAEYQKRVNRDDGIMMMIPFESTWTKILEEITNLREEVDAQKAEGDAQKAEVSKAKFL
jgi:hypothetical protein